MGKNATFGTSFPARAGRGRQTFLKKNFGGMVLGPGFRLGAAFFGEKMSGLFATCQIIFQGAGPYLTKVRFYPKANPGLPTPGYLW
jgi:hypothetical protein